MSMTQNNGFYRKEEKEWDFSGEKKPHMTRTSNDFKDKIALKGLKII